MKPHIIGIAGASSSGKTEVARSVARELGGASIVSLDSYYKPLDHLTFDQRERVNFDDPGALEWELLRDHLEAMAAGLPFDEPVYSFAHHTRTPEIKRIEPREFMIVEGILVLHWPEVRALLSTKVFIQTPAEVCYQRRVARDVAERGRTPESVRRQFEETVLPSAERYIYPTAHHADVVVSGEQPVEQSTREVLHAIRAARAAQGGTS
jgi:uridine kinase